MLSKEERGTKRSTSRVTIVFMTNMEGTEKEPILIIGKSKRPKCFGKLKDSSLPCHYTNTNKAWMNGANSILLCSQSTICSVKFLSLFILTCVVAFREPVYIDPCAARFAYETE